MIDLQKMICVAADAGNFRLLDSLRAGHRNIMSSCGVDEDGCTPLHHALQGLMFSNMAGFANTSKTSDRVDYVNTITTLLAMGLDASARDGYGQTPLMIVCSHKESDVDIHTSIVNLLLRHGANVNDTEICGPLSYGNLGMTALHYAVIYGFCSTARKLILLGADIEALSNHGQTPLFMLAIYYVEHFISEKECDDDMDTMLLLLLAGARTDCTNAKGETLMDALDALDLDLSPDFVLEDMYKMRGWKLLNSCVRIQSDLLRETRASGN